METAASRHVLVLSRTTADLMDHVRLLEHKLTDNQSRGTVAGSPFSFASSSSSLRSRVSQIKGIYVFGGMTDTKDLLDSIWFYSVHVKNWTNITAKLTNLVTAAACAAAPMIVRAEHKQESDAVVGFAREEEDKEEESETKEKPTPCIPPLPKTLAHMGHVTLDGWMYIIGGRHRLDACSKACVRYRLPSPIDVDDAKRAPPLVQWSPIAPLSEGVDTPCVVACAGGIYVIGGTICATGQVTNKVYRYDVAQNEWQSVAPLLVARSCATAMEHDGKIYVCGGRSRKGRICDLLQVHHSAECYDPSTNTWAFLADPPTSRSSASTFFHNEKVSSSTSRDKRENVCVRVGVRVGVRVCACVHGALLVTVMFVLRGKRC